MARRARPRNTGTSAAMRVGVLVLTIAVLITACGGSTDGRGGSQSRNESANAAPDTDGGPGAPDIATAIERTARYFENLPPRGDAGFLIGQGSLRLPVEFQRWSEALEPDPMVVSAMDDPASVVYLEALLWLKRGRPALPWPSFPPPAVPTVSKSSELTDEQLFAIPEVMSGGLRCEELDAAARRAWLDGLARPGHSYVLTHQLLSLTWARVSGCVSDAEANPLRLTLASAVLSELQADDGAINDLSLERMAVLCYADLCDWVTDRQTSEILERQLPDGSWGDGSVPINPNAAAPPEHTAALGFYVLAMKWDPATPPPEPPA